MSLSLRCRRADMLRGALIYATGDSTAALLSGGFLSSRLLGVAMVGALVYALEIPNYFAWIDRRVPPRPGIGTSLRRTGLAVLYFNPLWIARHLLFIEAFSGRVDAVGWSLLRTGTLSFAANLPLALAANHAIQNWIALRWRFAASATYSALMAVYYALSADWFR